MKTKTPKKPKKSKEISNGGGGSRGKSGGAKADCVIAGGGYVGLSLASTIKKFAPHLEVVVVDPTLNKKIDGRAFTIAPAAKNMLEVIGVWNKIKSKAQPVNEMIVTDSKTKDPIRPVFLKFGETEQQKKGSQPIAYMMSSEVLVGELNKIATEAGVKKIEDKITGFSGGGDAEPLITPKTQNGESWGAPLLVAADGVNSSLRDMADIKTVRWEYGQKGIVTTVKHEYPHNGVAEEHFLEGGPFAILPLQDNCSSLVWTEFEDVADRIINADDTTFMLELKRRFGNKLGEIEVVGKRRAFPLGMVLAREFVKPRFALAGDAAHGIHPIAGQGLNLGFKDVAALAQVVIEADRLGLDIGSLTVLERYQKWRRFDTVQMGIMTDTLNRLFGVDNQGVRLVRTIGLGIVDRMPELKKFFVGQAAGKNPNNPNLLNGEPI